MTETAEDGTETVTDVCQELYYAVSYTTPTNCPQLRADYDDIRPCCEAGDNAWVQSGTTLSSTTDKCAHDEGCATADTHFCEDHSDSGASKLIATGLALAATMFSAY